MNHFKTNTWVKLIDSEGECDITVRDSITVNHKAVDSEVDAASTLLWIDVRYWITSFYQTYHALKLQTNKNSVSVFKLRKFFRKHHSPYFFRRMYRIWDPFETIDPKLYSQYTTWHKKFKALLETVSSSFYIPFLPSYLYPYEINYQICSSASLYRTHVRKKISKH